MAKQRLDILLTRRGLAPSREKAKALIMAGEVIVNGQREDKPGTNVPEEAEIRIRTAKPFPYVSRGGLKLEKAVRSFSLDLEGKCCMDIGASTGGFTDVMLRNGASRVYAVDVGYGQLDWKLRSDPRVIVMEKTNIRYVTPEDIGERPVFLSIDVSFISLSKVLPPVRELAAERAELVCLIKPQFEAGRGQVGKKGVVRDPAIHREVIGNVVSFARDTGFLPAELDFSPIKGPEGNIEYLLHLYKTDTDISSEAPDSGGISAEVIAETVALAHNEL